MSNPAYSTSRALFSISARYCSCAARTSCAKTGRSDATVSATTNVDCSMRIIGKLSLSSMVTSGGALSLSCGADSLLAGRRPVGWSLAFSNEPSSREPSANLPSSCMYCRLRSLLLSMRAARLSTRRLTRLGRAMRTAATAAAIDSVFEEEPSAFMSMKLCGPPSRCRIGDSSMSMSPSSSSKVDASARFMMGRGGRRESQRTVQAQTFETQTAESNGGPRNSPKRTASHAA